MNLQLIWWTVTVALISFGVGLVFPASAMGVFLVLLGALSGYFYYRKYLKRSAK